MQITIVVVDDGEMDRYVARRYITRREEFDEVIESETGSEFIESIRNGHLLQETNSKPVMVLMDINMPGLNGFETAEALQQLVKDNPKLSGVVVMMFSSSDHAADWERAAAIPIVKGYIVKPLDDKDVDKLLEMYASASSE